LGYNNYQRRKPHTYTDNHTSQASDTLAEKEGTKMTDIYGQIMEPYEPKIIATIKAGDHDGRCQLYIDEILNHGDSGQRFVVMAITPTGEVEETPVWGRIREETEDALYKAYSDSVWDLQYTD
jgi:hypothetical protein